MPDQGQFVRQAATFLLACGLILCLLPGFAAAQNYTEVRAEAILNHDWGTAHVSGKHGWASLLVRLEQDLENPKFLDNIARYWGDAGDPMPTDGGTRNFSPPGVGYLINKHGHKLTQAQRDNLLAQTKRYNFIAYTNVKGETISSSWTPVDYEVPDGTPVLIRPTYSLNGVTIPIDTDFENELAVIKSPPLRLEGRVLTIDTPGGNYVVDWRGKVPAFSD